MAWKAAAPYAPLDKGAAKHVARCFCGRVELEASKEPTAAWLCSCEQCARLHGTADTWICRFDTAAVGFREPALQHLRWFSPDTDAAADDGAARTVPARVQCRHCGVCVGDERDDGFLSFPALFGGRPVEGRRRAENDPFVPREHLWCRARTLGPPSAAGPPRFADGGATPLSAGDFLRAVAPELSGRTHKGQAGRVGVLGGSEDYTGAPFYAAHSALRTGAELASVFTADAAAVPIKSYSPELMVTAVYRVAEMADPADGGRAGAPAAMASAVEAALARLHFLVVGPGLGRNPRVLEGVAGVIEAAKKRGTPLIIDADGLWLINQRPELVRGCSRCVLTPNAAEFVRLAAAVLGEGKGAAATGPELAAALGGPVLFQKGRVDRVCTPDGGVIESTEPGAPKRPGGLGDMLCGVLATVVPWAIAAGKPIPQACAAASDVARRACARAFARRGRAVVAPDVIDELGAAFEEMCPAAGGGGNSSL